MTVTVTVHGEGLLLSQARALEALKLDEVPRKLLEKDATLWGADAEHEASIRLGWLDVITTARELMGPLTALKDALAKEGVTRVILCGMGGSSLAPEVICRSAGVPLVVLDSTHPDQVRTATSGDLSTTVVVVSSKSGSTLETDSQRRVLVEAFRAGGLDPTQRIVVVTDPGSPFEELAKTEGYRAVFLADPHVGGRYSALTAFGLVPSALAGADVSTLLEDAEQMLAALGDDDNPALHLGAALGADKRDKIAINADGSALVGFGDWAEQLIAESTGKNGKGLLPVVVDNASPEVSWPAEDVHVVRIGPESPPLGTSVDGSLGAQMLAWEYAVAVSGRLLGIDPFDQPDVESAKKAARGLLDETPEAAKPLFVEGDVEVYASPGWIDGPQTLRGAVDALLSTIQPRGYLAVMAYLDRLRDSDLAQVRVPLARRTERPVTFGWGPRFLHSTGQYHKGGPPIGSFLQVTGLVTEDLQIPHREFTFGTLIAAQAAGDGKVLADHGRPVLRLNVLSPGGLNQVRSVLS